MKETPVQLRPDLAWRAAGLTGDASKILFDQPGAAYDQVHRALERAIPLPIGLRGRVLFVGTVLFAKHFLGGTSGTPGPLGRFVGEIADDALIETLKRIIEHAGITPIEVHVTGPRTAPEGPPPVPLARRIDAFTNTIAPWMGQ